MSLTPEHDIFGQLMFVVPGQLWTLHVGSLTFIDVVLGVDRPSEGSSITWASVYSTGYRDGPILRRVDARWEVWHRAGYALLVPARDQPM